ncbi:hypothetical protein [Oceanicola sp. 22II-s10i]|uniref:hypothetical protein n=1 Tax=Oceanicola sp. 22II-s10i TaxID=1317116 RepID=UPI001596005C|nr:hypothetical protein [Oceanicola sp. 22II-s10i]
MRIKAKIGVIAVLLGLTAPANATPSDDNFLSLMSTDISNTLQIIEETQPAGNAMVVTVEGTRNGGFGSDWLLPDLFGGFAAPGTLTQIGSHNVMALEVHGTENMFSLFQSGMNNMVAGYISGTGNSAAVMQVGNGNVAHFSQIGTGNSLAISQSSW